MPPVIAVTQARPPTKLEVRPKASAENALSLSQYCLPAQPSIGAAAVMGLPQSNTQLAARSTCTCESSVNIRGTARRPSERCPGVRKGN
jgi:hypothetical protein